MTVSQPGAKRVKVQVIDVFHSVEESISMDGERGGSSPARMGFFLGEEDEHLFLKIEDCPVTCIATEALPVQVREGNAEDPGPSMRAPALPPQEYHLGDVLDVCHEQEANKPGGLRIDFDYLTSQMTQGPTQDQDVCIQALVKQGTTPVGHSRPGEGEAGDDATLHGKDSDQDRSNRSTRRLATSPRCDFSPPECLPPPPQAPQAPMVPLSGGGSIFKTGKGLSIPVDPQRILAARRLLDDNKSSSRPAEECILGPGAGGPPAVDSEKLAAQRPFLVGDGTRTPNALSAPAPPAKSIFSTGAGISIKIDPEKLAASRRLLGEDGKEGASGARASSAPPQTFPTRDGSGNIFQTASGSAISVSKEKVDAAKRLLEDASGHGPIEQRMVSTPMMSRFAPSRMEQNKALTHKTMNVGNKNHSNTPGHDLLRRPRSSGLVGVQTPRIRTPQNAFGGVLKGGNTITPGSSIAGSVQGSSARRTVSGPVPHQVGQLESYHSADKPQFGRRSLPITPSLASKFAFSGMYGPGDVRAHLLSTGAVPEVVSDAWVRNHYKWVVWKLAMIELYAEMQSQMSIDLEGRARSGYRLGSYLHYDAVKNELSARYNREYVEGKRSYLKGVLQHDFPFGVPCVLKVASVTINTTRTTCTLHLTDGWYGIYAECDRQLLALAQSNKLFVGQKLRIVGADLTGGGPVDPLEVANETRTVLSYNQVHPMPHGAKLGAQPGRRPITPISYIDERGGKVPRTVVSVLRVFPPMVWSKLPSGVSTFQTAGKAGKAEASLESELERIYSQVKREIDEEDFATCKAWIEQGKAGGIKQVERLYAEMVVRGDTQFAENLNTQDKSDLETYIMERRTQMEQQRLNKVRDVLGAEVPAAGGAKTIPCQTMLVGEVSFGAYSNGSSILELPTMEYIGPENYRLMSLLTVWDSKGVKEGDVLSVSSLESFDRRICSQAYQGPFLSALKHLMATKNSEIDVLPAHCVPPSNMVRSASPGGAGQPTSRVLTTQCMLDKKERGLRIPNLFDVEAVVVLTSPVHLEDCLHRQWVFAIDYIEEGDGLTHPWVLAIKLSGPEDAINWFGKHAGNFVSHFGNVSLKEYDAEQRFVQLQGSMGTEMRGQVSDCTRLNDLLARNQELLMSLKTRLMLLLDQ